MKQEFKNYQHNNPSIEQCKDCENDCIILYDSHHDEYFSKNCGTVKMQNNLLLINLDELNIPELEEPIDPNSKEAWELFLFRT